MVTRLIRVESRLPIATAATVGADPTTVAADGTAGAARSLSKIVITSETEKKIGYRGEGRVS